MSPPQTDSGDYGNYSRHRKVRVSGHSLVRRCKSREGILLSYEKSIDILGDKTVAVCQVKPNLGKFEASSLPPNPQCQV